MAISVKCPNPECGKEYRLKDSFAGKKVRCRECETVIVVPDEPDAAEAPAAAAAIEPQMPQHHPGRLTCTNCGAVLGVRDAICTNCGADVRSGVAVVRQKARQEGFLKRIFGRFLVPLLVLLVVAGLVVVGVLLLVVKKAWETEPVDTTPETQVEQPEAPAE
jgi:hypothetical protein